MSLSDLVGRLNLPLYLFFSFSKLFSCSIESILRGAGTKDKPFLSNVISVSESLCSDMLTMPSCILGGIFFEVLVRAGAS